MKTKEEVGSVTIAGAVLDEKEVKGGGENEVVLVKKKLGSLPQQDDASSNKNIENKGNDMMNKDDDEDLDHVEKNVESAMIVNEEVRIASNIFSQNISQRDSHTYIKLHMKKFW